MDDDDIGPPTAAALVVVSAFVYLVVGAVFLLRWLI